MKNKLSFDWITENFGKKLFALALSLVIWFAVTSELHNYATFDDIPIKIKIRGNKYTRVNKTIKSIRLKIKGSVSNLKKLSTQDIHAFVTIGEPKSSGLIQQPLTADNVTLPSGLVVAEIFPQRISVNLDREVSKKVPVVVVTAGKLPENIKELEDSREVKPRMVTITGPESLIKSQTSVRTKTVYFDSSAINSHSSEYSKVMDIKALASNVDISPNQVVVGLKLIETTEEKAFLNIPVSFINYSNETRFVADEKLAQLKQVTLFGSIRDLEELKVSSIKAFVDMSKISAPGRVKLPVHVWVGNSALKVYFISPSSLDVSFVTKEKKPLEVEPVKKEVVIEPEPAQKKNLDIDRDLLKSLEK